MALITTLLSTLRVGETATIKSFCDENLSLKFLEMGCIPGEMVTVYRIAPMGDPMAISVSGYLLGLRKEEAATIWVEMEKEKERF
jgi:ferrous iron transport protein A